MNSKSTRKFTFNCRKKAIFGQKKVPQYGPYKRVWVINIEGSTFMPIGREIPFEGSPQVQELMLKKIIPEINKSVGKIWLQDQQNTYKSQIFPIVNLLIKLILFFLTISLIITLLYSQYLNSDYATILMSVLLFIWLSCVIITCYTSFKQYSKKDYDLQVTKQIKQILYQYNTLFLKNQGYIAKCDEWGIWICLTMVQSYSECGPMLSKQMVSRDGYQIIGKSSENK